MPVAQPSQEGTPLTSEMLAKQEFARRIYNLMIEQGWNQADLARHSTVGPDSISTYIRARSFPDPKSLKKLAKAFGLEPRDLLPNTELSAIAKEQPVFEMRQVPGHPDRTWLYINRSVSFSTAAKIVTLLQDEDERREKAAAD